MKTIKLIIVAVIATFIYTIPASAQKHTRWTDTLEYNAARGKKAVLCGDETFFANADQPPFLKDGANKLLFKDKLQQLLEAETGIDGTASIMVEMVVNCKGKAGSLKLLKYGDKENPAELELVKALNKAIDKLPDFLPAKNEGRVVNYKLDKLKVSTNGGKIKLG